LPRWLSSTPSTAGGPVHRPITTTGARPTAVTHEGAPASARDVKGELFLLAVANLVGEDTFYESAGTRDDRYAGLVRDVALADVEWLTSFVRWLRREANMRSAALVAAAEAVRARLAAGAHGGNRQLVDAALHRADEPGELVAYWHGRFGRTLPQPLKNGLGDALRRLYTERSLLKYDTDGHAFRFGDVVDLVHPHPADDRQSALFRYAIDRRHGRDEAPPEQLRLLRARAELAALPADQRRAVLADPERLSRAGMTWEALSGWLDGPMDAAAWESVIPSMGLLALARNLRNFDEAGVSDAVADQVAARFADPAEVARSRMFPFRWLAAYENAPSLRWGHALDKALRPAWRTCRRCRGAP
jgi:hypothetical protein